MNRFEITEIEPIGADLWKARVIIGSPEALSGIDVVQGASLLVRFQCPDDATVRDLIDAAVRKGKESLSSALSFLGDRAGSELLDELREEYARDPFAPDSD